MENMGEQMKALQSTVKELLARDKQTQLFNEMNAKKINDLEEENKALEKKLADQTA